MGDRHGTQEGEPWDAAMAEHEEALQQEEALEEAAETASRLDARLAASDFSI